MMSATAADAAGAHAHDDSPGDPSGNAAASPHDAVSGDSGLADVVKLVVANRAAANRPLPRCDRASLRLVSRDVCTAQDTAGLTNGRLTILADRVPEGAIGAQQLARLVARPGCSPTALVVTTDDEGAGVVSEAHL